MIKTKEIIKTSRFKGQKSLQVGLVHIVKDIGARSYKAYVYGQTKFLCHWAGYNLKYVLNDILNTDILEF